MQIEVQNLEKNFGKTKAVDDLTFSFETGNIFAFVGPNGAGKTTTMRMMATLDTPDGGGITFDGLDIVSEPEKARRLIGYMPDNLPTHRDLTVHDYLDFFGRAYGLRRVNRAPMIEQIEQFTNLTGIREKMLKALSKGMKQRVSLARALIHDPPLLDHGRTRRGSGPPGPGGVAGAVAGADRPRQGGVYLVAHFDRTGRSGRRRGDHREGSAAAGRHAGTDLPSRQGRPARRTARG